MPKWITKCTWAAHTSKVSVWGTQNNQFFPILNSEM